MGVEGNKSGKALPAAFNPSTSSNKDIIWHLYLLDTHADEFAPADRKASSDKIMKYLKKNPEEAFTLLFENQDNIAKNERARNNPLSTQFVPLPTLTPSRTDEIAVYASVVEARILSAKKLPASQAITETSRVAPITPERAKRDYPDYPD